MAHIPKKAAEWIIGDDNGASSIAIWAHMTGTEYDEWDHPWDPADLGRCLRLLELIPAWKSRIAEMANHSPQWWALCAHWQELHELMAEEVGIRWEKARAAPRTYARMKAVLGRDY